MTANRWWVQAAARWLARVDGVSGQIRLAMLIMTGLSTATLTLRSYGHGKYAWPLIATTAVGGAVYTYLYTEGGVWNQMQRDKADLSSNWASPPSRFNTEITARTYAAAQLGRSLTDEERQAVARECDEAWMKYRDGVDIEAIKERTNDS
jgi:hypothetical protein